MKRVSLIIITVIFCLAVSFDAVAAERLVAVIMTASQPRYQEIQAAFEKNSASFCGEACKVYVQSPNADTMSLRNSIRKAVALDADLIVTYGAAATLAAKLESSPIPVLFADVYDPVKLGLVSAKTGVGHLMSGVRGDAPVQALFKYFIDSMELNSLTVLFDEKSQVASLQKDTLVETGKRRKIQVLPLSTTGSKNHLEVLSKMSPATDGLFLASSDLVESQLADLIDYATGNKIPVVTQRPGAAQVGAFMTLETSAAEQGQKLAEMAAKLLSGTDIKHLRMEKPRDVSFVVNMAAAQACGIDIPFTVLSYATNVIK